MALRPAFLRRARSSASSAPCAQHGAAAAAATCTGASTTAAGFRAQHHFSHDFQYCGKDLGVVDVVYLLATSVDGDVMKDTKCADDLLETYYRELVDHVARAGVSMGRHSAETLMQGVEIAMVDWFRF